MRPLRFRLVALIAAYAVALHTLLLAFTAVTPAGAAPHLAELCAGLPDGDNNSLPSRMPAPSPVEDLGKYERANEPDDFRHRMKMNALAAAAVIVLIAVGIWIANTMAQMRKNQDCVLIGRPGCTPVNVPVTPR